MTLSELRAAEQHVLELISAAAKAINSMGDGELARRYAEAANHAADALGTLVHAEMEGTANLDDDTED